MSDYGSIGDGFVGLVGFIMGVCIFCFVIGIGGFYVINRFFVDHDIRSKKPIKPVMEIKYNQKTGVPDTTYVYVRP